MTATGVNAFRPDYAVSPGETLRARLEEIGLSQSDLATRSGLSAKHVNQIVKGLAPITQETALTLELVTGTPAAIWNNLEARYREVLVRTKARELDTEDKAWIRRLPVAELKRRDRLPDQATGGELFEAVLAFFGVADRAAWERLWLRPSRSFRRSTNFKTSHEAVATWVRLGELQARGVRTAPYSAARFRAALHQIRNITRQPDIDEVVRLCGEAGVVLVFVQEIEKCRISGATWWATPAQAVIALSDRYKRDDRFWFTFFHEAGHILLHSKKETFVDYDGDDDELEREADRYAGDLLIPLEHAERLRSLSSTDDVKGFAAELGIADGIVVGRLQHDSLWPWEKGNGLKRRVTILTT
jgi:HTH-type transcriptional regulator/antitoxin HigA